MKNYLLTLLTACVCFLIFTPTQAQNWLPLGPSDDNQTSSGTATYTSMATDSLGTLYAVYSDGSYSGKATVVKKVGSGNWTVVGTPGFTSGAATYTTITIGKKSTPLIVYSDAANGGKATVMAYNGTSWVLVGKAGFSAGAASYTAIDVNKNGVPFVTYADAGNGGNITVMRDSAGVWVNLGKPGFSLGAATYTSIVINKKTGAPYVAFCDNGNTTATAVTAMRFNGTAWVNIGTAGFSAGAATYSYIALDTANTPYVIFSDGSGGGGFGSKRNYATVMKFGGTSWANVGTAQFTANRASYCTIAFTKSDTLYASFAIRTAGGGGGGTSTANVMKFNGSTWVSVGTAGFSSGASTYNDICITPNGGLYDICADAGNTNKASVYSYNGTSWVLLSSTGFAKGGANYTSLSLDSKGTPYAAYSDASYTNNATVKMWTGGYWTTLGSNGFSAGAATYVNLGISGLDSLYVIYSDAGNANRATVMQYNGLGWLAVGTAGFSAARVTYTSIDFGVNDTLYACVSERTGGGFGGTNYAKVYKFNGASWVNLGGSLSKGAATYTSIAIDTAGVPYIAFCDAGNGTANSVTVMKYTGGAWSTVGTAGFSAGAATYTNIAISSKTNMPYVVYADGANSNKATLMMYNGTSWVNVGSAGFTPGAVTYTTMDFDPIDRPYVGYADGQNANKTSVMYFDGNNWTNCGNADFSNSGVTYSSIALDSIGNQFALATEGDPYAWKHSCLLSPIYMQPASNSVCVSTATYFVLNTDTNSTFQWQLNTGSGWNDIADTGIYTGTNTDSLVLSNNTAAMNNYQYRCVLTNYCGSDTTTPATLTVVTSGTPTITVTASPSDTICQGTPVTFNVTTTLGGSTPTYQWKKNGSNVSTANTYIDNGLASSDSIRCILTSSASCASTSSVSSNTINMYVNALDTPAVTITATPDTICGTTSVTYTANVTNNGGGAVSYQWFYNSALVTGQTGATYTRNVGGFGGVSPAYVQITITGSKQCLASPTVNSNSLTVVSVTSITPSITISTPKDTICKGNTVLFSSTIKNGSNFPTYQWNLNGSAITGSTAATLSTNTLNNLDSISCTLTPRAFGGGCTYNPTTVTSKAIKMTVNPIINPTVTFVAKQGYVVNAGRTDTFVASTYCPGTSASYVWYVNGVVVSGVTGNTFVTSSLAVGGNLVKVVTTCNAACGGSVTDSGVVTVTSTSDIIANASNVLIYPNPNNGQFNIKADVAHISSATCQVQVINALGQVVSEQNVAIGNGHLNTSVNMNNHAAGIYLVRVKNGDEVLFTGRINVQ